MSMRILSVVSLVSPSGAYGGPTRVAVNQARALMSRGHDVTIAAGTSGYAQVPEEIDGVPARLFPAASVIPMTGFAGLASLGLRRWLRRSIGEFDLVHVHAARDLITLPAAHRAEHSGVPFVVQTHGMIDSSTHPLARPLDAALTSRVLGSARRVFYLTSTEHEGLVDVGGDGLAFERLTNGVPVAANPHRETQPLEVLYLARLAPRKRPLALLDAAIALCAAHPTARFTFVGPDEGEGQAIDQAIATSGYTGRITREHALPPERTLERMARAAIYVLPSVNEPYPMSVLEAMSLALPVVITTSCGLAGTVREAGCGIVVDESVPALTGAIDRLLDDGALRASMGNRGRAITVERHSMDAIAHQLEEAYADCVRS